MAEGSRRIAGVSINRGSLDVLARLPEDVALVRVATLRALVAKGLAEEEIEQLVITDAGRKVLAAWKARGNVSAPRKPKTAAPAEPVRQGKGRTNPRARSTAVGTRGRRDPSAAAPNGNYLTELRAKLVAEHAAELAAIDKVLEIISELPA